MTNTTPAAVAFLRDQHASACYENGDAKDEVETPFSLGADAIERVAALFAQLEAAMGIVEMLADSVAKSRAEGRAEGLREAASRLNKTQRILADILGRLDEALAPPAGELTMHTYGKTPDWFVEAAFEGAYLIDEILALIPADTPAAKVQEAIKILLDNESTVTDLAIEIVRANRLIDGQRIGVHPALIIALRAIAGGEV